MMKRRFLRVLLCCAVLFMTPLFVHGAKAAKYTLDELGITVSMPPDYIVFTRDMEEDDPSLTLYGLTKDSLTSSMEAGNIYLDAWDEDVNQDITVTMVDSSLQDFSLLSDSTLNFIASFLESEYPDLGITLIKSEIYRHAQTKFLKLHTSQEYEGATVYGVQYYTVCANKAINITMHSYAGQFTAAKEALIKSVVDSVVFDPAPQTEEAAFTPTNAFLFTDSKTGVTFTVPENWVEEPLSKEREFLDVKFVSLEDDGMSILYGSTDLWEWMTASERSGYTRADIDNSYLAKTYTAEDFGFTDSQVRLIKYVGNEFYTATLTSDAEAYGISLPITITHMICLKNGCLHWFQFSGAREDPLFGDFEALLSSVEFPLPESAAAPTTDAPTAESPGTDGLTADDRPAKKIPGTGQALTEPFSLKNILLCLLLTSMIYSVPIVIYRYAVIKAPVDRGKAGKITLAYGGCVLLLMAVIFPTVSGICASGGAVLLWGWPNFKILSGGKDRTGRTPEEASAAPEPFAEKPAQAQEPGAEGAAAAPAAVPAAEEPSGTPDCFFCRMCGAQVPVDSTFCHKCGVKVYKGEE